MMDLPAARPSLRRPAARLPLAPLAVAALLLCGCGEEKHAADDTPKTPEAMYAKAQELLKPSAEREGPDFRSAMQWLVKAASAGHLQAQLDLGGIYFEGGKGVEQDPIKALKWFSCAAEQGDTHCLVFIGDIHYYGHGIPANPEKGMECWRKASDAGVAEADYCIGNALVRGADKAATPEGVEHLKKAALNIQGSLAAKSATLLGALYWHGRGPLEPDQAEAVRWYRAGADGGDPAAQLIYALMLINGECVPADEEKGVAYLRLAAGQDHLPAIAALVNYLRNAEGSTAEMEREAEAWQKRLDELQAAH